MNDNRSPLGSAVSGPILVSACLLGQECRYDGGHCGHEEISRLAEERGAIPICPELMGGLTAPRPPAEIVGGNGDDVLAGRARVLDKSGRDVTEAFVRGAEAVLRAARESGARLAVLKERSPSCGVHIIYDGSFAGRRISGRGVTAALLARHGIEVCSEEDLSSMPGELTIHPHRR